VHREQSVKREKTNKMQQSDVYYQLLSQHVSGIIMPIFRRTKACVTACGVPRWFCWMWLVAHSARTPQRRAPQPLPTTSSRTSAVHNMQ